MDVFVTELFLLLGLDTKLLTVTQAYKVSAVFRVIKCDVVVLVDAADGCTSLGFRQKWENLNRTASLLGVFATTCICFVLESLPAEHRKLTSEERFYSIPVLDYNILSQDLYLPVEEFKACC